MAWNSCLASSLSFLTPSSKLQYIPLMLNLSCGSIVGNYCLYCSKLYLIKHDFCRALRNVWLLSWLTWKICAWNIKSHINGDRMRATHRFTSVQWRNRVYSSGRRIVYARVPVFIFWRMYEHEIIYYVSCNTRWRHCTEIDIRSIWNVCVLGNFTNFASACDLPVGGAPWGGDPRLHEAVIFK